MYRQIKNKEKIYSSAKLFLFRWIKWCYITA